MIIYINYLMIWLLILFLSLLVWYFWSDSKPYSHKKKKRSLLLWLLPIRFLAIVWSITKIWSLYTNPEISNISIDALIETNNPEISTPTFQSWEKYNKAIKAFPSFSDSLEVITFADYVPLLREKYGKDDPEFVLQDRDFSYIWTWEDLYIPFSYAASQNMVWRNILPDQQIKCKHMVVMYGIAEGWDMIDDKSIDEYWLRASQEWILDFGCKKPNNLVIWSYLP